MTSIGFALMIAALVGGIAQLIGGDLCDRVGRKTVMNIGVFLQVIAFITLALAIIVKLDYFVFLIIFSFIEISGGLYRNVPFVMVGDLVKEGERGGAFSLLQIGSNLGLSIGPILGGMIAMFSYPILFILAAITNGIFLLISLFLMKDTKIMNMSINDTNVNKKTKYLSILQNRPFLIFCIVSALISIVYAQKLTTFSTYSGSFVHMSEAQIGLLFSFSGILLVFLQYPMTKYFDRYKQTTSLVIGSILFAIGFGALGIANGFWLLVFCIVFITFGEILFTPASLSIVMKMAPVQNRGRYISLSRVIGRSGYAIGPLIGGYLMDRFSGNIEIMWGTMGLLALLSTVGFLLLWIIYKDKLAKETPL